MRQYGRDDLKFRLHVFVDMSLGSIVIDLLNNFPLEEPCLMRDSIITLSYSFDHDLDITFVSRDLRTVAKVVVDRTAKSKVEKASPGTGDCSEL